MFPAEVIFGLAPDNAIFPFTSSFSVGVSVPNPILPVEEINSLDC